MIHLHIPVGKSGAFFETYFRNESDSLHFSHKVPLVLVVPGGGYRFTSDREAEPIALAFAGKGYQTAVLRYSIETHRFPESLCELAETMAWLRGHAEEYRIDPDEIYVCGFSAGAHLAGSLGVYWNSEFLHKASGFTAEQIKPNRMILSYPVIVSGPYAHVGSMNYLMGENCSEEAKQTFSLDLHVNKDTAPCFIWTTISDTIVKMENTLIFANALRKQRIPFEMHVFSEGPHGAALSNWVTEEDNMKMSNPVSEQWFDLCCAWLRRSVGVHEL